MLLCNIKDVAPGAKLGASVMNPGAPGVELLKPGVALDRSLCDRLSKRGVTQVWIEHDLTADLDAAIAPRLMAARMNMYTSLKDDMSAMSRRTLTTAAVHEYRTAVMELVLQVMSNVKFASMTDQLFTSAQDLFSHSTNVAYLATIIGLELRPYLVRERPRLSADQAQDLTSLGLGAMLHDIGKVKLGEEAIAHAHEIGGDGCVGDKEKLGDGYFEHALEGYQMLRSTRAPASAAHVVLNHHQRYDGGGWPNLAGLRTGGANNDEAQAGRAIHVFSRIVAAANAIDNLMFDGEGQRRPPICALHDFASSRFDGWFDPVVRQAVLRRVPPFGVGVSVHLSDGAHAVVTAPNTNCPCRPIVRLLDRAESQSADGSPDDLMIDLSSRTDLHVVSYAGVNIEKYLYELKTTSSFASPPQLKAAG